MMKPGYIALIVVGMLALVEPPQTRPVDWNQFVEEAVADAQAERIGRDKEPATWGQLCVVAQTLNARVAELEARIAVLERSSATGHIAIPYRYQQDDFDNVEMLNQMKLQTDLIRQGQTPYIHWLNGRRIVEWR